MRLTIERKNTMPDSEDMDYNRSLWRFVKDYCDKFTMSEFADMSDIPVNTLSRNLGVDDDEANQDGFFARPTYLRVTDWVEQFAAELHTQGHPLKLDGVKLPLRPESRQGLGLDPGTQEDEQTGTAADGMADGAPSPEARKEIDDESRNGANKADAEVAEGAKVVIPGGVSITRPELRGQAAELWDRAALFGNSPTSDDLERVFGVSLLNLAPTEDEYAGWLGPSLPEGTAPSADMHDEIVRLTRNWLRYSYAHEICEEIEYFRNHYAFRYIRRTKLEIEVVLIGEFRMTHPDGEITWDEFQRRREIEWRVETVAELQDVEYPSFQEILVFGTIKVSKGLYAAVSGFTRWMFRLASRQTRR